MQFTLTDHRGRATTPRDWVGQPTLVFFGFTWCPDVCPTTLSEISGWLDELGPAADDLNVAFVTVDPERDTPEKLADYVSYFDPAIVGYTGAASQIASAASGFRATYEKMPRSDGDYTMNHTASVFLFRADGSFAGTVDPHEPREYALPKIRRILP